MSVIDKSMIFGGHLWRHFGKQCCTSAFTTDTRFFI